ncbi:MAG TPA: hypothetical protein VGZ22_18410 [Isosphaeraceae bacterium]|nr:hypothetical protein [Isosphaeraceae bacterium]
MFYAVTVEPLNAIFFLVEKPVGNEWPVEEGVNLFFLPPDYRDSSCHKWLEGAEMPATILCRSTSNPKYFKVFRHRRDLDPTAYNETGRNLGGFYPLADWERLVRTLQTALALEQEGHKAPPAYPGGVFLSSASAKGVR